MTDLEFARKLFKVVRAGAGRDDGATLDEMFQPAIEGYVALAKWLKKWNTQQCCEHCESLHRGGRCAAIRREITEMIER